MRAAKDATSCSGCGLCALVCPLFRESPDIARTPWGRFKALQGGADVASISTSIDACLLCGACEPVCPENIPAVDELLRLRANATTAATPRPFSTARPLFGRTVVILGDAFPTPAFPSPSPSPHPHPLPPLPFPLAGDPGSDLSLALRAGSSIPPSRASDFLRPLAAARRLIVADALLARWIRARLPRARVEGLGEALLFRAGFAAKLGPGDFYVLDAASYHLDHARLVRRYDRLRHARGCEMNLDLHRIAIPTHDPVWLLKGRRPSRIVVESVRDLAPLAAASSVPVVPLVSL